MARHKWQQHQTLESQRYLSSHQKAGITEKFIQLNSINFLKEHRDWLYTAWQYNSHIKNTAYFEFFAVQKGQLTLES
jgi:hypothetical protein